MSQLLQMHCSNRYEVPLRISLETYHTCLKTPLKLLLSEPLRPAVKIEDLGMLHSFLFQDGQRVDY